MMSLQRQALRSDDEIINDLILELSLVTAAPVPAGGRSFIRATAAATAMANVTGNMDKKDLRRLEWTVDPLVRLLLVDIDDPVAAKTAFALSKLMSSRICMTRLVEGSGLSSVAKVLDVILSKYTSDLKEPTTNAHAVIEHIGVCYREIARFHPWKLVEVGGLRHCVAMLRYGDVSLQTISAMTMASLSNDLEICKQMFSYGAIKPLLNVSDAAATNDACMLAGLGCVTQLCRIPEIALRMVQQGVVPVLERALHRREGHNHDLVREKALYALGFLSRIDKLKASLCTQVMLDGLMTEFHSGTLGAKTTILSLLINMHGKYPQERAIATGLRDDVLHLLRTAPWVTRNLCLRVFCVVYRELEDCVYFAINGLVDCILDIVAAKDKELQETPLVALLHLCEHPQLPFRLLRSGVLPVAVSMLSAQDSVIRELAVVLLKTFLLYDQEVVMAAVPADKRYVLTRDVYNPQSYGAEYGGLIQEFLQGAVEHRRAQDYLINQFSAQDMEELALTREELVSFQNTFMEIDADCSGALGVDELKMLMVLMGEEMDREEVQDLLIEYDADGTGALEFKEFVVMMKGWDTRFGTGLTRLVNIATKRGPVGKSLRLLRKWWNKENLERAQVEEARERNRTAKTQHKGLVLSFLPSERLAKQREVAVQLREEEEQLRHTRPWTNQSHQSRDDRSVSSLGSQGWDRRRSSVSFLSLPPVSQSQR